MKRIYSFALFVVLLFCTFSLKATKQEPDYIIYEGKRHELYADWACPRPMDAYFIRTKRGNFFEENRVVISSGNWRAYVATWEIRNNKLYLVEVTVDYIAGVKELKGGREGYRERSVIRDTTFKPGYYSINSLNGQQAETDGAVFADWFTGILNVDNREANWKRGDKYKGSRYIYVKDGNVVDDQLLTKKDFNRIEKKAKKGTADHKFMKKYRMYYLHHNYHSYWIQNETHDIMLYNGEKIKIRHSNNTSLIENLYNNEPLEYPYNWENLELSGVPSGIYSIEGDSIFLNGVVLCSGLDFLERDETNLPLSALFNEKDIVNKKVFANWVSGDVYLYYGKTVYLDYKIERFFTERMQKIVFDSGRVVGMEWAPCDFDSDIASNPVSVCDSSKMYVSKSRALNYYTDTLRPKTLPYWTDGDSALNTWFGTQTMDIDKNMELSVAFVVNCKGEAGNWTLLELYGIDVHDYYNKLKEINKLFDVLSKLPNKWVPATDENGNPVDCRMAFDIRLEDKKLTGEINLFSKW